MLQRTRRHGSGRGGLPAGATLLLLLLAAVLLGACYDGDGNPAAQPTTTYPPTTTAPETTGPTDTTYPTTETTGPGTTGETTTTQAPTTTEEPTTAEEPTTTRPATPATRPPRDSSLPHTGGGSQPWVLAVVAVGLFAAGGFLVRRPRPHG